MAWQLHAAKQRFSELVERAQTEGPQVVTKHGRDAVVVVSADEWARVRPADDLIEFIRSGPDLGRLDLAREDDDARDVEL